MKPICRLRTAVRLGGVGLAALISSFGQLGLPNIAHAASERTVRFDLASDCRTFNYTRGLRLDQIVRGDGFIMNGRIFPAGTLPAGPQNNDPNAAGSIGSHVARGTSTATLAEHLANPQSPGVFWTQYFMLNVGPMLVSEGWFAPGGANLAAITGGTGAFRGARGEVFITNIGTNVTGCSNARVRIVLNKGGNDSGSQEDRQE